MASSDSIVDDKNIFSEFEDPEREALIRTYVQSHLGLTFVSRSSFFSLWFSEISCLREFLKEDAVTNYYALKAITLGPDVPGIWAGVNKPDDVVDFSEIPKFDVSDEMQMIELVIQHQGDPMSPVGGETSGAVTSPTTSLMGNDNSELESNNKCFFRDMSQCVVTGEKSHGLRVAYIIPNKLNRKKPGECTWDYISLFWGHEKVKELKKNLQDKFSHKGVISTQKLSNQLLLDINIHHFWEWGICGFRPIWKSPDDKEIRIAFHWFPPLQNLSRAAPIRLSSHPFPDNRSGFPHFLGGSYGAWLLHDGNIRCLESGHIFTVKTDNPETHPLPSMELLQLRWDLSRIANMQGVGEIQGVWEEDLDDFDFDDIF